MEKKITIKDVIAFTFAVLLAVIGYFINQRLSSIDYSIKEFQEFQKIQISSVEKLNGQIDLLKAKDIELERRLETKK